eukprot:COSAG06_NODE_15838_length_1041_cov_0.898089_2_plen_118_part_00
MGAVSVPAGVGPLRPSAIAALCIRIATAFVADSACACACACVRLCVVVVRCLSGHLAGMHGGGRAGERVAWHGDQRLTRDPGGRGDAHARQERATRAPGLTVADTVMLRNSNDSLLE